MDEREQQLADLQFALGRLVDPVLRYCDGDSHAPVRARQLRAQLQADLPGFVAAVGKYGAGYESEVAAVRVELAGGLVKALVHFTYDDAGGPSITKQFVEKSVRKVNNILATIPKEPFSAVLSEGSPFRFYTWLRALCENASARFVLVDPYPSAILFTRYLRAVPDTASCIVVTRRRSGQRDWEEFDAASSLFSTERGGQYQARLHPNLHDRFVANGSIAYHVGASIKDAGIKAAVTVSPCSYEKTVAKYVEESTPHHPPV